MTTAARRATSAIFLVCGTATSAWAPMVPFAKTRLGLDQAALGIILLALGGGSMIAMPLAGVAIQYWGSRPVIVTATVIVCVALPFLAAPMTPLLLACTLLVFGAGLGAMDVAMNAQAIAVQHAAGRSIMSGFHTLFSVGGLVTSTSFSDGEVSFLLGFDDPNSFYRAFRSWNGMSPSEFRRHSASGA